ncbi:ATP-binding protein [Nocardia sp. NPDC059228]|uniref:ATP-binding protein n=1 Tax=Nocardia sp. NPDC059228 TaxID=3346777 RepID=UPI0036BB0F9C
MSSMRPGRAGGLVGRDGEREAFTRLLDAVRAGESQVLVLRGDAGIGKSALLDNLTSRATGLRVLRVIGMQSEMELVFAALHQLCGPLLDRVGKLPAPQGDALRTAFGLSEGPAPKPFMVGLAVLGLLSEAAEDQPLLCVVDDHHWVDRASAQVLGFVARRLAAERVGVVFGTRVAAEELAGIPELAVTGLSDRDAHSLLESAMSGSMDARVRDQIVAETRGNPLAMLEWARGTTWHRLAGGFGLPDAVTLSSRIEDGFRRQLAAMPDDTCRLLQLAAADPSGDAALVWKAASALGIGLSAATPAVEAGVAEFSTRVWFRHPLLRSVAYRSASDSDRRDIHRALSEATDPTLDPDRRAWHRARATVGPDDAAAADLERSAARAQARGGPAAAAAFLERAGLLSADPRHRVERLLAAAQANLQAGSYDSALGLLATMEVDPLDPSQRARADLLRGQIAFASGSGNDAPGRLLRAAIRLSALDLGQARETFLSAWIAAVFAGGLAFDGNLAEISRAAQRLPRSASPGRPEQILHALSLAITAGAAHAAPVLREVVDAFDGTTESPEDVLRWSWLAHAAAVALWDHAAWRRILERNAEVIRCAAAADLLPVVLSTLGTVTAWTGDFAATAAIIAESEAVCQATGASAWSFAPIILACLRGDRAGAEGLVRSMLEVAKATGQGLAITYCGWAMAVLHNGLGNHDEAVTEAVRARESSPDLFVANWALPELVEAAMRTGRTGLATSAVNQLVQVALPGGTEEGLGLVARCRALTSTGAAAAQFYREAIERLARTELRPELARAHLLYGEWLHREGLRDDAREHLRTAHDMFADIGTGAFAERARRELLATGKRVRRRQVDQADALTDQEALIARLARDGRTNPEIGAQLFLSARTVEWHLRKVFTKLDIGSRRELASALAQRAR